MFAVNTFLPAERLYVFVEKLGYKSSRTPVSWLCMLDFYMHLKIFTFLLKIHATKHHAHMRGSLQKFTT